MDGARRADHTSTVSDNMIAANTLSIVKIRISNSIVVYYLLSAFITTTFRSSCCIVVVCCFDQR